ncbi:hypothetical protein BD289DRAFT_68957 [Coniella lustricola]|uniref:Uncharacterized protein n=1 Tax=Coniella lustricola TaxID=2025994 RepID=A0A2T3A080_9PEZI|nr:hypothetical protein BD289DRAFT_68957 [Coniella lustricola]
MTEWDHSEKYAYRGHVDEPRIRCGQGKRARRRPSTSFVSVWRQLKSEIWHPKSESASVLHKSTINLPGPAQWLVARLEPPAALSAPILFPACPATSTPHLPLWQPKEDDTNSFTHSTTTNPPLLTVCALSEAVLDHDSGCCWPKKHLASSMANFHLLRYLRHPPDMIYNIPLPGYLQQMLSLWASSPTEPQCPALYTLWALQSHRPKSKLGTQMSHGRCSSRRSCLGSNLWLHWRMRPSNFTSLVTISTCAIRCLRFVFACRQKFGRAFSWLETHQLQIQPARKTQTVDRRW